MLRYDAISLQARLRPATVALHDLTTDRRWTYAEADLAVSSAVAALARLGVGAGDRVALYAKNCADTVLLHFACARRGAMLVPYNWRLAAEEIAALNADAEPRLILVDEGLPDPGLDAISMEAWRDEVETADVPADSVFDHDRASLILYTSGTTGRPKGAVLTEGNLAATAHNFAILGAVGAGSVFLCDAPMFHVIGLVANVRPVLLCGGTLLVSDGFDPERALRRLMDEDLGVTHYFCVPQMAHALRAQKSYDPDRLRRLAGLFTGGAPHAAAQIEAWLDDGIAAVDGYGMSEVGTLCSMPLDLGLIRRHAGAVGVAPPGVALRIGDGEGRAAPEGEPGEVFVQGPNVFTGYWRDDTATKDAFTEDGWFRTGDVG
ncbi:MAG: AMP-binding protein, partial [Caulobacterales bacterium]|nr:AMP-binding protein [Caulobacterales bacterium]